MKHQSMSAAAVQKRIDTEAQKYGALIRDEAWSASFADDMLINRARELNYFQIAGLAKAIACFACEA